MKEQSLDNFFDELVIILLKDLGFYIPSEIILVSALEELGDSLPV